MLKRGQVTIFLAIGIILLFVTALSIYLYTTFTKKSITGNQEQTIQIESIKNNLKLVLEQCLEGRAVEATYLASIQGGIIYLDEPTEVLITNNANIKYATHNDKILLKTEDIEQQISKYITQTGLQCDFTSFIKEGVIIEEPTIEKIDTTILNKKITISSKIIIKASLGSSAIEINNLQVELPLALGDLLKQAQTIIQKQQQNSAVYQPTQTNLNYFITYFPYDEITSIYSISDTNSLYNNAPLTFMFAIQQDHTNYPPKLDHIPDFSIQKNSNLQYQLTATDPDKEPLVFYSKSNKISVTNDGLIDWTPTTKDIILVTFGVRDTKNKFDEQEVRIVVQE